jgi:hypothetical protein
VAKVKTPSEKPAVTPFSYITAIMKNLPLTLEQQAAFEKIYSPWLTNNHFASHPKTVFIANAINVNGISKRQNFEYYRNAIKLVGISYIAYIKAPEVDKDIAILMEYYKCSESVAKSYSKLLPKEEKKQIEKKILEKRSAIEKMKK